VFKIIPFKRCPKCGETKLATHEFWSFDSAKSSWCRSPCRACTGHRPVPPVLDRIWAKVDKNGPTPSHRPELGPCWIWTGQIHEGYGRIRINKRAHTAHRVLWALLFGEPSDDICVCHKCDNPQCMRPEHMFLGTRADNNADRESKGRYRPHGQAGEAHHAAKLTDDKVREIRALVADGSLKKSAIARRFGVSPGTVSNIISRLGWSHVV
jgi:HNH endonuclease